MNPFQVKPVSPELLVGRRSEIDLMFDQIANKSHLAIYGGSGIGKSSLRDGEIINIDRLWRIFMPKPNKSLAVLGELVQI